MEAKAASLEVEEDPKGLRKPSGTALSRRTKEQPGWRGLQEAKQESCRGVQQRWEAQWQEFLKTLQSPCVVWENPEVSEAAPWDDAKAFLASFEQVAKACRWPRGEWAARLLPALSGEAQQAFSSLEATDREDYEKVKATILRGDAIKMEVQRQHFRQFRYQEIEDPRRIYSQLQELCCQWLKPERHSKEQILELLILEQFLASLPPDLQGWIRAGGPDSCSQAVALVEDFLMSQQETEARKWEEPLHEQTSGASDVEGALSEADPKRIHREAKQSTHGEVGLLGSGSQCLKEPNSLLPPEGKETAKAGRSEGPMSLQETGVPLHVVEPAPTQPGQRTMFWQVMQEEDGDADSLEGLLVPKPDLTAQPEEEEEQVFIQFPVESERLPGQDSGHVTRSRIKMETSKVRETGALAELSQWNIPVAPALHEQRCDEKRSRIKMGTPQERQVGRLAELSEWNVPVTAATLEQRCDENRSQIEMGSSQEGEIGTLAELSQWNIPVAAAIHEQRCDEKRSVIKMKNSQQGEVLPEEMHSTLAEIYQWNVPVTATLYEQRYESKGEQGKKRGEEEETSSAFPGGLTTVMSEPSTLQSKPKKLLVSRLGRKCNYRLGIVMKHAGEDHYVCPVLGGNDQQKACLVTHQRIQTGKKSYDCSECGKSFHPRSKLIRHQKIHTRESPYECLECGKSFISRGTLMVHQIIHTGEKPFGCLQCGKCFNQRTNLLRHQRIHTGEKVHECPKCGKKFYRKDKLIQHQRVHTGEKPYKCPDCGKNFTVKEKLLRHQRIHLEY
ncbi:zinc finger protein 397-like isoform X1 [Varanus komodoensis]|uniref:zinc finger protein 397-like isoform X1 n=1 Tax=Varanus komodoensis TaxID=61221 RepID=UPI001CF768A6|nr:zinc finger protein 397-like isoform X1 [Varanus komodoensis]